MRRLLPDWKGRLVWAFLFAANGFVLGAALCGCPKPGPTPVNPTPDASDAARPVANCDAACLNERGLGCLGAPACPDLCPKLLRNHPDYVACVTAATSCDVIGACDKAAAGSGKPTGPGGGRTGP